MSPTLLVLVVGLLGAHALPPPPCHVPCPKLCQQSVGDNSCQSCVCPNNVFNVTACPNSFFCPEKCVKYESQSRCHICRCDFRI